MRNILPCRQRTYPIRLAEDYCEQYRFRLHWLKYLLERMGQGPALALWDAALRRAAVATELDKLTEQIISGDWQPVAAANRLDVEDLIASSVAELFPVAFEGLDAAKARSMIDAMPPFAALRARFGDLNVTRQISSYDTIHLFYHDIARLAEKLIETHGKRGELIAYDAMLFAQVIDQKERLDAGAYLRAKHARFQKGFEDPTIFTAGLERKIVRASDKELVWQVTQCEWARYFRQHHPTVGSIVSCTTDHALYGSHNRSIRLQLTSTLMEGSGVCNFRLYSIDNALIESPTRTSAEPTASVGDSGTPAAAAEDDSAVKDSR